MEASRLAQRSGMNSTGVSVSEREDPPLTDNAPNDDDRQLCAVLH